MMIGDHTVMLPNLGVRHVRDVPNPEIWELKYISRNEFVFPNDLLKEKKNAVEMRSWSIGLQTYMGFNWLAVGG
jgi:hypothetical protein